MYSKLYFIAAGGFLILSGLITFAAAVCSPPDSLDEIHRNDHRISLPDRKYGCPDLAAARSP